MHAALRVLAEIGMRVLDAGARDLLPPGGRDGRRATPCSSTRALWRNSAPPSRRPSRWRRATPPISLHLRGRRTRVFASVGGPAYVMDNDRGRRDGTYAEMCDYLRLIQSLNILHQEGGGPFEPLDLPANTRHLDIYHAQITLLDKNWQTQTLGHARTMDGLEMAAIALGTTPEGLIDRPTLWASSTPTRRCSSTFRWPRG